MSEPVTHRMRVRYNECDPQGIVFNANYLVYADIATNELWRRRLGGYRRLTERGLELAVASAGLQFRSPLRFDDEFTVEARVTEIGTSSIASDFLVVGPEGPAAEIELVHVCFDARSGRSTPLPDDLRGALR